MSSKSLRLLQIEIEKEREKEREKNNTECLEDDNSDDKLGEYETSRKFNNIFDLLREESQDESVDIDEDVVLKVSPNKQKRQKKKKKKNNAAKGVKENATVENLDIISNLKEVDLNGARQKMLNVVSFVANKNILNVEHKCLNHNNELKKIFGAHVIESDKRKQRSRNARRFRLVNPRPNWAGLGRSGLAMDLLESKDGNMFFSFEHSRSYREVQQLFLEAVESADPSNMINLLRQNPFHIDSLLQVCEICKLSEDWETATEMIERALYVFEQSFHPMFSLTQGTSRLDYTKRENRSFYLALFQHLMFLGKKGCYRTSLEFCKLILSFSPESDPLGILLTIDLYALKSDEHEFLARFYEEWNDHKNLFQLPNFAFSYPLALFHLGCQTNDEQIQLRSDCKLQDALLMYPGMLMSILDKISIVADDDVIKHEYFRRKPAETDSLRILIQLYVSRTFSCWKEPKVVGWLEKNVRTLISNMHEKKDLQEYYTQCRLTRYVGTPRNVYRHLIISEVKDLTFEIPTSMSIRSISHYDPLPPPNSTASYEDVPRIFRGDPAQASSLSSIFLQSLLPSFNPDDVRDGASDDGGDRGGELARSVGAFMEGLRGLLNSIRFVPTERNENNGDDAEPDWENDNDF